MFIGTRRRKNFRKGQNISGHLQSFNMDPGSVIPDLIRDRGDGLLKKPGHVRPQVRHSGLDRNLPRSAARPFAVIPDLTGACPGPRIKSRAGPIRGNPCSSERDGGRPSGKNRNISGHLQPINMDPGSSPGVTSTEETRIRPALFRHSGLDPESMFIGTRRRKGYRKKPNISSHLQPINMDPGSSPG
jgi:hypothetical protein